MSAPIKLIIHRVSHFDKKIVLTNPTSLDIILQNTNLGGFFQTIVTRDDIKKSKPDPETFLLASQKLYISPQNCLVIEDAEKGIIAAHRAGMKSIAIPNEYTSDNNFSLANLILKNIKEITLKLIEKI